MRLAFALACLLMAGCATPKMQCANDRACLDYWLAYDIQLVRAAAADQAERDLRALTEQKR